MSRIVEFAHSVLVGGTEVAGITLAGARISYGAKDPGETPKPASAHLELISADAAGNLLTDYPEFTFGDAIPSGLVDEFRDKYEGGVTKLVLGQTIEVGVKTPSGLRDEFLDAYSDGFETIRFSGYVTALDVSPSLVTVTAVAPSEALTRITVERKSWPVETDVERVHRISNYAGIGIVVEGDATVRLLGTKADEKPEKAWKLLTEIAEASDALLYANREGTIIYRSRTTTGGSTTEPLQPEATLLDGLTMTSEIGQIVNAVSVEYGDPKASVYAEDLDSATTFGIRDKRLTLPLADRADAEAHAHRILNHYADPFWHLPSVNVNLLLAKDSPRFPVNVEDLLSLDLDDAVRLPYLLPASPLESYESRILGIDEILDPYAWTLIFALNPAGWTMPAIPSRRNP